MYGYKKKLRLRSASVKNGILIIFVDIYCIYLQSKVFTKVGEQDTVDGYPEQAVEYHQDSRQMSGWCQVSVTWNSKVIVLICDV